MTVAAAAAFVSVVGVVVAAAVSTVVLLSVALDILCIDAFSIIICKQSVVESNVGKRM